MSPARAAADDGCGEPPPERHPRHPDRVVEVSMPHRQRLHADVDEAQQAARDAGDKPSDDDRGRGTQGTRHDVEGTV
jgi:hypothetical protein